MPARLTRQDVARIRHQFLTQEAAYADLAATHHVTYGAITPPCTA